MASTVFLVFCTCPDKQTAEKLANHLVDTRLAACVSITAPVTSVYIWEGRRERADETLVLIKTTRESYPDVEQAIRELHPYELPEVIAVPVEQGLTGYLRWVSECTSKNR